MAPRRPTDTRAIERAMQRRLAALVVFVLVVIGSGLIAVIYGPGAGMLGLLCLATGAGVIGLLWLVFTLLERWAQ